MAKYILEEMLRVRKLRKDFAEKAFNQAQKLLHEAQENVVKAEKALSDFRVFVEEESARLYKKIILQKVKRGAIDELHYAIKVLKNKLTNHEQALQSAKDNLVKAEQNLEEKREKLREANKNVEKIESHKVEWTKVAAKEEEMALDKELEEFAKKKTHDY